MTTHVFIVTEDTFQIHLNYMFAGTGKGDGEENIGMISDISGCRIGDKVIFYVENVGFFGVFEVVSEPFWDETGEYLTENIVNIKKRKKLTNRVLIKPFKIYPLGVPEWEALDNLDNLPEGKDSPANKLIWSLIYRKLEGARGCTPIFDYESNQLIELIVKTNEKSLNNVLNYNYNSVTKMVEELNNSQLRYDIQRIKDKGIPLIDKLNQVKLTVEEKILKVKKKEFKFEKKHKDTIKINIQHKCEEELEYFFVKNVGVDTRLKEIIGGKEDLVFWGSQIFCGVGKRRIDVLAITKDNVIKLIELKDDGYHTEHLEQVKKYVRWAEQYIREPEKKKIQPILVLNKAEDIKRDELIKFNEEISKHSGESIIIYIWKIEDDEIKFEEFIY